MCRGRSCILCAAEGEVQGNLCAACKFQVGFAKGKLAVIAQAG
eukprot:COSAG01_NODE_61996_length_286_cov_12.240642_1_plen_42_part_10